VSRFQPLRPKSYLFKNCATGLAIATLVSSQPAIAQTVQAPTVSTPEVKDITNRAEASYEGSPDLGMLFTTTNTLTATPKSDSGLVDPLGVITGCNGQLLPNPPGYTGYTVALYDVAANGFPANLTDLTPTTSADGIGPNIFNDKLFTLKDPPSDIEGGSANRGKYNFLFDKSKNQLKVGRKYILVVKPKSGSAFGERMVRLDLTGYDEAIPATTTIPAIPAKLRYLATSLDGKPIATIGNQNRSAVTGELTITDAATQGVLISLGLDTGVCEDKPVQIIKSADRATAEPGDTVVYRLALKNQSADTMKSNTIFDTLPRGMSLRPGTVRAQIGTTPIPLAITQSGNANVFKLCKENTPTPIVNPQSEATCTGATGFDILPGQTVNLAYAVTLDSDAIRGDGRNLAKWEFKRNNNGNVEFDTANNTVLIRQGLIRDTGTLIGRVFVDKNFDGQQQVNEPGIPNAVIYMDDGNRVTTDPNGLFSVQSAIAGYRTGALDLSTLPGYSLAPNLYFSERNSRSRLVKLAPGGIVRMNFGVTPTAREVK
jgi:uncharacterized repeat protein (TIGR01451 family)